MSTNLRRNRRWARFSRNWTHSPVAASAGLPLSRVGHFFRLGWTPKSQDFRAELISRLMVDLGELHGGDRVESEGYRVKHRKKRLTAHPLILGQLWRPTKWHYSTRIHWQTWQTKGFCTFKVTRNWLLRVLWGHLASLLVYCLSKTRVVKK